MHFGRSLLLGLVAGAVLALSIVPWPLAPLVFVFPALLLAALTPRGAEGAPLGLFASLAVGLVAGTTTSAIVMYWIPGTLERFGGFPTGWAWAAGSLAFVWHGLAVATATGISGLLAKVGVRPERSLPAALAVSFSLVVPLFAWRPTIGALPMLAYVQTAELSGATFVDFTIALVGCYALVAYRHRGDTGARAFRRPAAIALAALILPFIYGLVRLPMVETAREEGRLVRVGVVQPNVSAEDKEDETKAPEILTRLQRMTRKLAAQGADLVAWPESAYPYRYPRAIRTDLPGDRSVAGDIKVPIVFGSMMAVGSCGLWNSVLALEDGRIRGVVDKVRRLPGSEYIPFWEVSPRLRAEIPCPGVARGDDRQRVLELFGVRIGIFNCYEDVLASRGFRVVQQEPDFLLNVTNDVWFGHTLEPFLHHSAARVRSLETRRDMVRAVNTGISAHVSATGADLTTTPIFKERSFIAEVRTTDVTTPFSALGDWLRTVLVLGLLGVLFVRLRAAFRSWRAARKARKAQPA